MIPFKKLNALLATLLLVFSACSGSLSGFVSEELASSLTKVNGVASVNSLEMSEGEIKEFTILFDQPLLESMTINWMIQPVTSNSALSKLKGFVASLMPFNWGADFALMSASIVVPVGERSVKVSVEALSDDIFEGAESFTLTVVGANLKEPVVIPITLNDSNAQPILSFNTVYVNEGLSGNLLFNLNRRSSKDITFDLSLLDNLDQPITFVNNVASTVTIPANQLMVVVPFNTVRDNGATGDRSAKIVISNLNQATLQSLAQQYIIVIDLDAGARINLADATITEGASGNKAIIRASLTQTQSESVTFLYSTRNSSALAPADYTAVNEMSATIAANASYVDLEIDIADDNLYESTENFVVLINSVTPNAVSLGRFEATVTINDNDTKPVISWQLVEQTVQENVGTVTVRANLTPASGQPMLLNMNQQSSSTVTLDDHNFSDKILVVPAGQNFIETQFQVQNDNLWASEKSLIIEIPISTEFILSTTPLRHTVKLQDDDSAPLLFVGSLMVTESDGDAELNVSLGSGIERGESLSYNWSIGASIGSGFATLNQDFSILSANPIVVTGPANTSKINLRILSDSIAEGSEKFSLTISNPQTASIPPRGSVQMGAETAVVTIADAQSKPRVSFQTINTSVLETSGVARIDVQVDQVSGSDIVIPYQITNSGTGSAELGTDYHLPNDGRQIRIPQGQNSASLEIALIDNNLNESEETIVINLQTPLGDLAELGTIVSHTVIIEDNDSQPAMSITNASALEGSDLFFNVNLTSEAGSQVTADYTITNGTAIRGTDFTSAASGTVTFLSGQRSQQIRIPTTNNTNPDGTRTFTITLSNVVGASLGTASAVGSITDDEGPLGISINDVSVDEGGTINFTVTLSAPSAQEINVNYETADGNQADSKKNATLANSDYTQKTGILNIPANTTSASISVNTTDDSIYEDNEQLRVILTAPAGVTLSKGEGIGTINNNDAAPAFEFQLASSSVNEGVGTDHTVEVKLLQAINQSVSVDFVLLGSATFGSDYTVSPALVGGKRTLTFAAGEQTKNITITVINDTVTEGLETISLQLQNQSSPALMGNLNSHMVNIEDNDQPAISITNASANEGSNIVFDVNLTSASTTPIQVDFAITPQTATLGLHYNPMPSSGTLLFSPGHTSRRISVPTIGNSNKDTERTILVTLSNPNGATLSNATAIGTILDDEGDILLSINDISVLEGNALTFTVSSNMASVNPITVSYNTADGDQANNDLNARIADSDYTAITSAVLTIPAGQLNQTITVNTTHDTRYEEHEQMRVVLSNPSTGAFLQKSTGYGTITNNDTSPVIRFSSADSSVTEGIGVTHQVTVTLGAQLTQEVRVDFNISGTAVLGADYENVIPVITGGGGTLVFSPGDTSKTIQFSIKDDGIQEPNKSINIQLSNIVGPATPGTPFTHTVTLIDNDFSPTITSFTPLSGDRGSIPTSATILFTKQMSSSSVTNIANWTSTCGSISSITLDAPGTTATVIMASANLVNGDSCSLTARDTLVDIGGSTLTGDLSSRQRIWRKIAGAAVSRVTSLTPNGNYKVGDLVDVRVEFTEPINLNGASVSLRLKVRANDADNVVVPLVLDGNQLLRGTYTIRASDYNLDLNVQDNASLFVSSGGSLTSQANGALVDLTVPVSGTNALAGHKDLFIDTKLPTKPGSVSTGLYARPSGTSAITFTSGSDDDRSASALTYEAQIVNAVGHAAVTGWTQVVAGQVLENLSPLLIEGSSYKVAVRTKDPAGNYSSVAEFSSAFQVDGQAPSQPVIALGPTPNSLSLSPTVGLTSTDLSPGSGMYYYEVKVERVSDGSTIKDWQPHVSGNAISFSPDLANGVEYRIRARAYDQALNVSVNSTSTWVALGIGDVTFTANGSWTVPTGCNSIEVETWGGGGGGGSSVSINSSTRTGPPGGRGAYLNRYMNVTPGSTLTIVIGMGGEPGFASSTSPLAGALGGAGYSNGGNGGQSGSSYVTNNAVAGGGGGSTAILQGSTLLVLAGGGGGGGVPSSNNGYNSTYSSFMAGGNANLSSDLSRSVTSCSGECGSQGSPPSFDGHGGQGGDGYIHYTSYPGFGGGGGGGGHATASSPNAGRGGAGGSHSGQVWPSLGGNPGQSFVSGEGLVVGSGTTSNYGRGGNVNVKGENGAVIIKRCNPN